MIHSTHNDIPEGILYSFDIDPASAEIREMSSGWSGRRCFDITGGDSRLVLKRWKRPSDIDALWSEERALALLRERGYRNAAYRITTGDGWSEVHLGEDVWTAYPFYSGDVSFDWSSSPESLRDLIRGFHACTLNQARPVSRLERARRLAALLPPSGRFAGTELRPVCEYIETTWPMIREHLRALPVALVHGDLNASNILAAPDGDVLIDFEFARYDVRLVDYLSLTGAKRESDGELIPSETTFVGSVLSRQEMNSDERGELTEGELKLFPHLTLYYWGMVLVDQIAAGSRFAAGVASMLDFCWRAYVKPAEWDRL